MKATQQSTGDILNFRDVRSVSTTTEQKFPQDINFEESAILSLTAIVTTFNEKHNIAAVIESLNFADEIFVVDSHSTDGTYELALKLADRVVQRTYHSPSEQKNWAIAQAKHDWILLLDADERVTPSLRQEIFELHPYLNKRQYAGYWIGRDNHFMGRQIKHSGWRNDKVVRLFHKNKCRYNPKRVHETIVADGDLGNLKHKLYHNTYVSIDNYFEKLNRYASAQAKDYDHCTGKLTGYHFLVKPFWGFCKHYFLQGGFRDGVPGLTISFSRVYAIFMRYVKLWLLRRNRV